MQGRSRIRIRALKRESYNKTAVWVGSKVTKPGAHIQKKAPLYMIWKTHVVGVAIVQTCGKWAITEIHARNGWGVQPGIPHELHQAAWWRCSNRQCSTCGIYVSDKPEHGGAERCHGARHTTVKFSGQCCSCRFNVGALNSVENCVTKRHSCRACKAWQRYCRGEYMTTTNVESTNSDQLGMETVRMWCSEKWNLYTAPMCVQQWWSTPMHRSKAQVSLG